MAPKTNPVAAPAPAHKNILIMATSPRSEANGGNPRKQTHRLQSFVFSTFGFNGPG
jgi:hypothetical protein